MTYDIQIISAENDEFLATLADKVDHMVAKAVLDKFGSKRFLAGKVFNPKERKKMELSIKDKLYF